MNLDYRRCQTSNADSRYTQRLHSPPRCTALGSAGNTLRAAARCKALTAPIRANYEVLPTSRPSSHLPHFHATLPAGRNFSLRLGMQSRPQSSLSASTDEEWWWCLRTLVTMHSHGKAPAEGGSQASENSIWSEFCPRNPWEIQNLMSCHCSTHLVFLRAHSSLQPCAFALDYSDCVTFRWPVSHHVFQIILSTSSPGVQGELHIWQVPSSHSSQAVVT